MNDTIALLMSMGEDVTKLVTSGETVHREGEPPYLRILIPEE